MTPNPRSSHEQHRSHATHVALLSPTSPQLWITPVNKRVNNRHCSVRFAGKVRLSPYVDHLWTAVTNPRTHHRGSCGHLLSICAQSRPLPSSSPAIHQHHRSTPTSSPQRNSKDLRGKVAVFHTFPTTYDDDYIDRSMNIDTNNDTTAVDDSRTLSILGSVVITTNTHVVGSVTYLDTASRTPHEGGLE